MKRLSPRCPRSWANVPLKELALPSFARFRVFGGQGKSSTAKDANKRERISDYHTDSSRRPSVNSTARRPRFSAFRGILQMPEQIEQDGEYECRCAESECGKNPVHVTRFSCTTISSKTNGGGKGIRTPGLYVANVPLSQLSYTPTFRASIVYWRRAERIQAGGGEGY